MNLKSSKSWKTIDIKQSLLFKKQQAFYYFWHSDLCNTIVASVSPNCVSTTAHNSSSSSVILQARPLAIAVIAAVSSQGLIFITLYYIIKQIFHVILKYFYKSCSYFANFVL
jgi:hypothetical protein